MHAGVVKLVDALDSKSSSERSVGSSPTTRTIFSNLVARVVAEAGCLGSIPNADLKPAGGVSNHRYIHRLLGLLRKLFIPKELPPRCGSISEGWPSYPTCASRPHPKRPFQPVGNLGDDIGNHHVDHDGNHERFEVIVIQRRG